MRYETGQKRRENRDWIGTCSGVMREARSEGCHCGKTGSGVAKILGDGGAAELQREALWKEGSEGEPLALVVLLLLEVNASLWWLLRLWWWWLLLSRVTEGVLAVATVAEPLFRRCGGTYDIVWRNLLVVVVALLGKK